MTEKASFEASHREVIKMDFFFGGGVFRTLGWGFLLFGFVALGGRTVNAATWTVDEDNVTNAAPLVLRETLTITGTGDGFVQTGAVSGTGDLHFSLPGKTAFLLAPNTSAGDLYVDLGILTVPNAAALGTGTVYVNEEETSTNKTLCLDKGMSISNPLVLGSEETARWAERIRYRNGTFNQNGKITVHHSKLAAQAARVHVMGGIEGDKVVFAPDAASAFVVETKPPTLTECLWAGGAGTVRLAVAGTEAPSVYGFGTATLVLEGTNFFPHGANFATQNSDSHFMIDANGHDQYFGSFAGEGATKRPCTLLNAKDGTCPTLTLEQTQDNLTTNLHFRGAFHLVKAGTACLTVGDAVEGDLEVRAGTYALGREIPESFAHAVVVKPGARLDLGGQTAFCEGTVTVEGGTVANGTLRADRIVLKGTATVTAKLVGTVMKEGAEESVLLGTVLGTAASGQTLEVAEGVLTVVAAGDCVANWPFRSAETLFTDASGHGHDLIVGAGNGAKASADSPFGMGAENGSLELDGQTWLTAEVFPDLPIGNEPRTIACFVKPAQDLAAQGAVLCWGHEAWGIGDYMNFAFREFGGKMGLFPWGNFEDFVDFGSADRVRGRWMSFVAVWDGSQIAYYTNGVLALAPHVYKNADGQPLAELATVEGGFKIGKAFYGDQTFFKGNLAELAVWRRALTEGEVRAYASGGAGGSDGMPDNITLEVAAGATCRLPGGDQVLAGLGGAGTVEGNVTLKEGAVVRARDEGPVTVVGTLTFAGDGTVVLPAVETPAFARYPLFAATQFAGEGNLAAWRCANVPKGYKAAVEVRGGVVEAVVRGRGMAVFIR